MSRSLAGGADPESKPAMPLLPGSPTGLIVEDIEDVEDVENPTAAAMKMLLEGRGRPRPRALVRARGARFFYSSNRA